MRSRRRIRRHFFAALLLLPVLVGSATGAGATCGDVPPAPATLVAEDRSVTASDALAVLRAAVGSRSCAACVCDVNNSGAITATDALAVLRVAVGQPVTLSCPSCQILPDGAALATAFCEFQQRCEPAVLDYSNRTFEDCVTDAGDTLERRFGALSDAIAAGRTEFLPLAYEECLAAYEAVDCDLGIGNACQYLLGKATDGQGCSLTEECADGLFCDGPPPPACGVCHPRVPVGGDCSTVPCVAGAICLELAGDQFTCIRETLAVGAPCGTPATGLCRGHLQCTGEGDDLACVRPAAIGQACDLTGSSADCDLLQSAACVGETCVPISWNPPGSSCAGASRCDDDGYCQFATSKCDTLPTAGKPCIVQGCAGELFCSTGNLCTSVAAAGAACDQDAGCEPGLLCAGPNGAKKCEMPSFETCP